jgi:energy-coupling factor transporter ATP-binding protein EcfA2
LCILFFNIIATKIRYQCSNNLDFEKINNKNRIRMVKDFPVWLNSPPDGSALNPPLETRAQGLPFTDLSWQNFERLVLRLVRLENSIADGEIYGIPGQNQSGIDILAEPKLGTSKKVCYQCKKVKEFKASDIKSAVDKFLKGTWLDESGEFVLCTTCPLETTAHVEEISKQRKRLKLKGVTFTIWDGSESGRLSEKLKKLPELVDDFFGRPWVKVFNGQDAAVQMGHRLDNVDLVNLRHRLKALYTVLFNQHDPGLRTPIGHVTDYLQRYVLADIFTVAKLEPIRAEQTAKPPSPDKTQDQRNEPNTEQSNPESTATSIFETRSNVFGWLNEQKNCVVLGEAGYGKSALLRHIALAMLRQEEALSGHLDSSKLQLLPVWMSFPAFSAAIERKHSTSVEDHFREWLHQNSFNEIKDIFERSLRTSKILLLVDGLDEATTQMQAQQALDRIVAFAESVNADVICTSRPLGFNSLGVPISWTTAQLAALSDQQICEFSSRWFALSEGELLDAQHFKEARLRVHGRAEAFLGAVRANARTHQLARIPLLCQTLIELFRTKPRLPDERQAIYSLIIELLLTSHPDARARAAGTAITVESLGLNLRDIREILIKLAWNMQYQGRVVVESVQHLETVCSEYLMDEEDGLGLSKVEGRHRAQAIISALFKQFGVLVEKAPNELGFVHLSIQEYLAADAICRRSETEQLDWISEIWMQPRWRECLINWFGIQGAQGKKVFIGQAASRISDLGKVGEYERMQALQLRAALVCADLGFPINEARKVIFETIGDMENSPFQQHRIALAKELTIGALSFGVREECSSFISDFSTGRTPQARASLIEAFKTWKPADDLKLALLQGMKDEEFVCRRAAANTLAAVFLESDDLPTILCNIAIHEPRPEVRASALRALGLNQKWSGHATKCADANSESNYPDLVFETIKIRILQKRQNDDDLNLMIRLMTEETISYWQVEEFYDVFYEGWPNEPRVKAGLISKVSLGDGWSGEDEGRLVYLIKAYPGDQEVAELLFERLKSGKMHFTANPSRVWPLLASSFQNHPELTPLLWELIAEHRQEYESIIWHPDSVGAFMAIGDNHARDELITTYENIEDQDGIDKYWIAHALSLGWPQDEHVKHTFQRWSQSDINLSAPLAGLSTLLFEDIQNRRSWLEHIVTNSKVQVVQWAYFEMMNQFPDHHTWKLISQCLSHVQLWKPTEQRLKAKLAAMAPSEPASQITFKISLNELDGPPVADWAASVESIPKLRSSVLRASVTASAQVRMAIASTLRDRMADYDNLLRLIPQYLAEANNTVRSTILLALAQTGRGDEGNRATLEKMLHSELDSNGPFHANRKLSAVAGLLELGSASLVAKHFKITNATSWTRQIIRITQTDPVALSALVKHWVELRPMLEKEHLPTKWPVEEIIAGGYISALEQSADLKKEIDLYLHSEKKVWINDERFVAYHVRKYPRSDFLRATLIGSLQTRNNSRYIIRRVIRLLATHFREDTTTLHQISSALVEYKKNNSAFPEGILGYLAIGWRNSPSVVNSHLPKNINSLGVKDRLLIFTAQGDKENAEQCAREFFNEPLCDWRQVDEKANYIREWAADKTSQEALYKWIESDNPSLSMTAISLLNEQGKISLPVLNKLRERFNAILKEKSTPLDGLDAVFRGSRGWAITAYSALLDGFEA